MRKLKLIVVVDQKWGIGKDGGLLVHIPGDLKYFKEKTLGNIVIMGRATLESLPGSKPLPGRTTIILTRNNELKGDFLTANSIEDLMNVLDRLAKSNPDAMPFVAGGEDVYRQLLPYTDCCLVTKILKKYDAEKFFPNLDEDENFECVSEGIVNEENDVKYQFTEYKRVKG